MLFNEMFGLKELLFLSTVLHPAPRLSSSGGSGGMKQGISECIVQVHVFQGTVGERAFGNAVPLLQNLDLSRFINISQCFGVVPFQNPTKLARNCLGVISANESA